MRWNVAARRRWTDRAMTLACGASVVLALVPVASLLAYVLSHGIHRLDLAFFTHLPAPVGEASGGMANAVVGTLELVAIACLVGVPVGVLAGTHLAEYGREGWFGWTVRFTADVLSGVPSIVTGIVAYRLVVRPMGHFSAWAGGIALGFMMIPTVVRTTEELVKMVPGAVRESALALGVPEWRTVLRVVLATARTGIATGILLAVARIAGETAPLLFTSFNNQFWPTGPGQPTASLTVQVFTYAISPFQDWHDQAWTGALVLLSIALAIGLAARLLVRRTAGARH